MGQQGELNFLEFFQKFRRGELLRRADDQMEELMQAIRETGGKGTLTIELPFSVNKAGQIECVPVVKMKAPNKPIGTGIYYVTDEGRLTTRDPDQLDMMDEFQSRRETEAAE